MATQLILCFDADRRVIVLLRLRWCGVMKSPLRLCLACLVDMVGVLNRIHYTDCLHKYVRGSFLSRWHKMTT